MTHAWIEIGAQCQCMGMGVLAGLATGFPISPRIRVFAKLGDSSVFHYWLDDWSNGETLHMGNSRNVALARDYKATLMECWDDTSNPILEGSCQTTIWRISCSCEPISGTKDGWEWRDLFLCSGSLQDNQKGMKQEKIQKSSSCVDSYGSGKFT